MMVNVFLGRYTTKISDLGWGWQIRLTLIKEILIKNNANNWFGPQDILMVIKSSLLTPSSIMCVELIEATNTATKEVKQHHSTDTTGEYGGEFLDLLQTAEEFSAFKSEHNGGKDHNKGKCDGFPCNRN
jgi:hypothetical protein